MQKIKIGNKEYALHRPNWSSYDTYYVITQNKRFKWSRTWKGNYNVCITTNEEWEKLLYRSDTCGFNDMTYEEALELVRQCISGEYNWNEEYKKGKEKERLEQEAKEQANHQAALIKADEFKTRIKALGITKKDVEELCELLGQIDWDVRKDIE